MALKSDLNQITLETIPLESILVPKWYARTARKHAIPGVNKFGLLHQIIVRRKGKRVELLAGLGRLQAWKKEGRRNIQVSVRECDDRDALVIHGLENLGREDLDPKALGKYFNSLQLAGYSTREISRLFGEERVSQPYVTEMIALYRNLTAEAMQAISDGKVPWTSAARILDFKPKKQASDMIMQHAEGKLNLSQKVDEFEAKKRGKQQEVIDKARKEQQKEAWANTRQGIENLAPDVDKVSLPTDVKAVSPDAPTSEKIRNLAQDAPAEVSIHVLPERSGKGLKIGGENWYSVNEIVLPILKAIQGDFEKLSFTFNHECKKCQTKEKIQATLRSVGIQIDWTTVGFSVPESGRKKLADMLAKGQVLESKLS